MRSKRCKNACEILRLKAGISKWLGGVRLPKLVVVEVGVAGCLGGECRVNTLHHECQGVRSCAAATCGHWTISH